MDGRGAFQGQPVGTNTPAAVNSGVLMSPIFTDTQPGGSGVRHHQPGAATPQSISNMPPYQGKYFPQALPGSGYSYLGGYMTSVSDGYKGTNTSPGSLPIGQFWTPSEGYSRYNSAVYSPFLGPMVSAAEAGPMFSQTVLNRAPQPYNAYHKLYESQKGDSHYQLPMVTASHGTIVSLPSSMTTQSTLSTHKEGGSNSSSSNARSSQPSSLPASKPSKESRDRDRDANKASVNGKDRTSSKNSESSQKSEQKRSDGGGGGSKSSDRKSEKKPVAAETNSLTKSFDTRTITSTTVTTTATATVPTVSTSSSSGGVAMSTSPTKVNSAVKERKASEALPPPPPLAPPPPFPANSHGSTPAKLPKKRELNGTEKKRKSKKKHDVPNSAISTINVSQAISAVAMGSSSVSVTPSTATRTTSAILPPTATTAESAASSSIGVSKPTPSVAASGVDAASATLPSSSSSIASSLASQSTPPGGHTVVQVSTPASLTITSQGRAILSTSSKPVISASSSGYPPYQYPGYFSHSHNGHDREKDGHKVHATTYMPEVGTVAGDMTVSSITQTSNSQDSEKSQSLDSWANSSSLSSKEDKGHETAPEAAAPVSAAAVVKGATIENTIGKIVETTLTTSPYLPHSNHSNHKQAKSNEPGKSASSTSSRSSKSEKHERSKKGAKGTGDHGKQSKSDGVVKLDIPPPSSVRSGGDRMLEYRDTRKDAHHSRSSSSSGGAQNPHPSQRHSSSPPKDSVHYDVNQNRDVVHHKEVVKIHDSSQFRDIIHDHNHQGRNVTLVDHTTSTPPGGPPGGAGGAVDAEAQRHMMEWNHQVITSQMAAQYGYCYDFLPAAASARYAAESEHLKMDKRPHSRNQSKEALKEGGGVSCRNGQSSLAGAVDDRSQHATGKREGPARSTPQISESNKGSSHNSSACKNAPSNSRAAKQQQQPQQTELVGEPPLSKQYSSRNSYPVTSHHANNTSGPVATHAQQPSLVPPLPTGAENYMLVYPGNKAGDGRYPPVGIAVAQQRQEKEGESPPQWHHQQQHQQQQQTPSPSTAPPPQVPLPLPPPSRPSQPATPVQKQEPPTTASSTPHQYQSKSAGISANKTVQDTTTSSPSSLSSTSASGALPRPTSSRPLDSSDDSDKEREEARSQMERSQMHLLPSHHGMDKEREQFLREQRDLYMKPSASHMLGELSSNLIVTGGGSLPPGVHQWEGSEAAAAAAAQQAQLAAAAHWLPRAATAGGPPVWLGHSPYGLPPTAGHPALHHGSMEAQSGPHGHVPLSHTTGLQLARDPSTGQFVLIPSDAVHNLEVLDRGTPIWPYTNQPSHLSSHGHQLQQIMLNQHQLQHQQLLQRQEQQRNMDYIWQQHALMNFYKQAQKYQEEQQQKQQQQQQQQHQQQQAREAEERQQRESQAAAVAAATPTPTPTPKTPPAEECEKHSSDKARIAEEERQKHEEEKASDKPTATQHPYIPAIPLAPGQSPYPPQYMYPPPAAAPVQYFYDHTAGAVFPVPASTMTATMATQSASTSRPGSASPVVSCTATATVTVSTTSATSSSLSRTETSLRSTSVQTVTPPAEPPLSVEAEPAKEKDDEESIKAGNEPASEGTADRAIQRCDSPIDVVGTIPPSPSKPAPVLTSSLGTMTVAHDIAEKPECLGKDADENTGNDERTVSPMPRAEMDENDGTDKLDSASLGTDSDQGAGKFAPSEVPPPDAAAPEDLQVACRPAAEPVTAIHAANKVEDLSAYASSLIALKKGELKELTLQRTAEQERSELEASASEFLKERESKMALVPKMELSMETLDQLKKEQFVSNVIATTQSVISRTQSIDPEQWEAIEGIALLSEAAVQRSLQTENKIEIKSGRDLVDGGHHGNTDLNANHYHCNKQEVRSSTSEYVFKSKVSFTIKKETSGRGAWGGVKFPPGMDAGGMDASELEMRMKLAELQRKYKEKQKELARLQRRKDKDHKSDDKNSSPVKRGPGRPRKRKFASISLKGSPGKERHEDSSNGRLMKSLSIESSSSSDEPPKKKKVSKDKDKKASKDVSGKIAKSEISVKPKKKKSKSNIEKPGKIVASGSVPEGTGKVKVKKSSTSPSKSKKNGSKNSLTDSSSSNDSLLKSPKTKKMKVISADGTPVKVPKEKKKESAKDEPGSKSKSKGEKSGKPKARGRPKSLTCSPPDLDELDMLNLECRESWLLESFKSPETPQKKSKENKEKKKNKEKDKGKTGKVKKKTTEEDAAYKSRQERYDDIIEGVISRYSNLSQDEQPSVVAVTESVYDESNIESDQPTIESGLGLLAAAAAIPKTGNKRKRHSSGMESDGSVSDSEVKKRKPGRPKKGSSPVRAEQAESPPKKVKKQTSKPKSPKSAPSEVKEEKPKKPKKKKIKEEQIAKALKEYENERPAFLDEDQWQRRRSERIFLSDTSPVPSRDVSPISKVPSLKTVPETLAWRNKKEEDATSPPKKPRKTSTSGTAGSKGKTMPEMPMPDIGEEYAVPHSPSKVKKKPPKPGGKDADGTETNKKSKSKSKKQTSEQPDTAKAATSVKQKPIKKEPQDGETENQDGYSDNENIPLSSLVERPVTPEPRSCVVQPDELMDDTRVLIPIDGLFYTGHINAIQAPDIYGVVVDGQRGNRPHVFSQEQILQEAIHEVKPGSVRYLCQGTRVCAYWSQQYRCLYPGTVSKGSPNPSIDDKLINVEFDDGDSGRIPLHHIRLLPPDYPIVDIEPSPIMPQRKRRRRTSGDISSDGGLRTPSLTEAPVSFGETTVDHGNSDVGTGKEQSKKAKNRGRKPNKIKKDLHEEFEFTEMDTIEENMENDVFFGENEFKQSTPVKSPSSSIPTVNTATSVGSSESPAKPHKSPGSTKKTEKKNKSKDKDKAKEKQKEKAEGKDAKKKSTKESKKDKEQKKDKESRGVKRQNSKSPSRSETSDSQDGSQSSQKSTKRKVTAKGESLDKGEGKSKSKHADKKSKKSDKLKSDSEDAEVASVKKHKKHKHSKDKEREAKTNKPEDDAVFSPPLPYEPPKKRDSVTSVKSSGELGGLVEEPSPSQPNAENMDALSFTDSMDSTPMASTQTTDNEAELSEDEDDDTATSDSTSEISSEQSLELRKGSRTAVGSRKARKARLPSASKIAAFLPARQLWRWCGKATQRRGMKGKAKKVFYKAICRDKEVIRVNDCAVFLSTGRPHLPYVGRIESMWEAWGGNMVVKVKWFYHPEETKAGRRPNDGKMALYQSPHVDENDVQTISHKCEVLSIEEYQSKLETPTTGKEKSKHNVDADDVYYLAGTYDPATGMQTEEM